MPKKIDSGDKENFLKLFREGYYSIRKTCKEIGIGKSTFYRWMQESEFKEKMNEIKNKRKESKAKLKKILKNHIILRRTIRFLGK